MADGLRQEYALALGGLARICDYLAERVRQGDYPMFPGGDIRLVERVHRELLIDVALEARRRPHHPHGGPTTTTTGEDSE